MVQNSHARTIFKICSCGKAARVDNFKKQHSKLIKDDSENHTLVSIKYYCIACKKFKFQNEGLKAWHLSHQNCKVIETSEDILDTIFHDERKQITSAIELNKAVNNILDKPSPPVPRPVSTLSDSSSDSEEESITDAPVSTVKTTFADVATQTDVLAQNNEPHPSVINAREQLVLANRQYKDEICQLKSHNGSLKKQVDEYINKKNYLDSNIQKIKELEQTVQALKLDVHKISIEKDSIDKKFISIEKENEALKYQNTHFQREISEYRKCERRMMLHLPMRNNTVVASPLTFDANTEQLCFKDKKKCIQCIHIEFETNAASKVINVRHVPPYRKKRKLVLDSSFIHSIHVGLSFQVFPRLYRIADIIKLNLILQCVNIL